MGEKFFRDTVRMPKHLIREETLLKEIDLFFGQEAIITRSQTIQ